MNNKLLRRLRNEAKRYIYLAPFKFKNGNVSEIIIVNKKYESLDLIYYYGKVKFMGLSHLEYFINSDEVTTPERIEKGYTFEEALKELEKLRREYILLQVSILKRERDEKIQNKLKKRVQKLLNVY